jgi:RNA polymerase sigma-70 factor (ECF subfamily)
LAKGQLPGDTVTATGRQRPEGSTAAEAALVRSARRGDVQAFGTLVTLYQDRVWRFLATWVTEREDREELVQEVFLAAHRGIRKFRGDAKFSTWLLQIALNQARGFRRSKARRPREVSLPESGEGEGWLDKQGAAGFSGTPAAADSVDDVAARRQISARVWTLISQLPEEWQAAMRLRYQEEMSHPEIAAALGVPVGTVKAQLHRGRHRLADWLDEEGIK